MATNKYIIQLVIDTGSGEAKVKGVAKVFEQLGTSAKKAKKDIDNTKKGLEDLGGAAGIAGATAAEFGRLISDLPYGLSAVTNNISQLGSMFALLVSSSGGVAKAMKNLGSVLLGPAGILIAFQAVVAAVEYFSRGVKDATKATAELNVQLEAQRKLLDSIALTTNEQLNKTLKVLTTYSSEFKGLFEGLLQSQGANSDAINELVNDYSNLLRIRRQIESKEKAIGLLTDKQDKSRKKLLGEINQLRLDEVAVLEQLEKFKPVEDMDIDSVYDFGKDAYFEFKDGFTDAFIDQGYEGFFKVFKPEEEEPYFPFIDLLELEGEIAIETEQENAKKLLDEKKKSIEKTASLIDNISAGLNSLNEILNAQAEREIAIEKNKTTAKNDELRKRLANEQLSAEERDKINQQIAKNDSALVEKQNEIARKQFKRDKAFKMAMAIGDTASSALRAYSSQLIPGDPTSLVRAKIAAALATAFGLAQVAAISRTKYTETPLPSPNLTAQGAGSAQVNAPDFNVVGASDRNQLAEAIAGVRSEPLKAYVVASDVTSAQELERKIVVGASI